jgi:phosphoribosylaminoimidazolecarboxamide formyltransferase/IMP cyclohydrolase
VVEIHRALISVSDKCGLAEFAGGLHAMGVEIIATGGTAEMLKTADIPVRPVSEVTGFPEILDGRVKTLHPKIHGALLGIADNEHHRRQMEELDIAPIDMVVVNLYPFERTVTGKNVPVDEAVEQIDIGGPSMLRSAAKNFMHKAVIVNPGRYAQILEEMRAHKGCLSEVTRLVLAQEVFHHTASYDAAIAAYFDRIAEPDARLGKRFHVALEREMELRYGENPHQRAALYGSFGARFSTLHGKELSYNNIVDIASAEALVAEFDAPTVAIIKHTNPCGVGSGAFLAEAYGRALATDVKSAFGGIVAMNRPIDMETAQELNAIFTEVVVARDYPDAVLEFLRKKRDRRIVRSKAPAADAPSLEFRTVPGGVLVQEADGGNSGTEGFHVVTKRQPTAAEIKALRFAWRVAKHVKSNAIVYADADRTLGVGAGQMSRIDAARIAAQKAADAGIDLHGSVVGSDAFFPFADGLLAAVDAGSTAVIQPGGSVRDGDVITAADDHGIAMVFTGVRHFKH